MSTNYPGSKDSFPVHVDNNNEKIAAAAMNNVQDSITSIENVLGIGSTQPTAAATPNAIVVRDANGVDNSMGFSAAGLAGATSTSRYVGATASGTPTTGTFAVGDFVIDRTGVIWICTVAGTPGTWVSSGVGVDTWHAPTLLNGWINANAPNATAAYRKDANGYVHLKGNVLSGTTTGGTAIFQLPAGYRPSQKMFFATGGYNGTNDLYMDIFVDTNGNVCVNQVANNTLFLNVPPFLAEQ